MNWIKTSVGAIIRADLLERVEVLEMAKEKISVYGTFQESIDRHIESRFLLADQFKTVQQAEEAIENLIRSIDSDGGSIHCLKKLDED